MPSVSTRSTIVTRALAKAGRSAELRSAANEWLNDMLKNWALSQKLKELQKIGVAQDLVAGSTTSDFPDDMGAGVEKILLGTSNVELIEKDMEEFVELGGMPMSSASPGQPTFYLFDKQAEVFRFNRIADQTYSFIPIYYRLPDDIDVTAAGDTETIWLENEKLAVEGLIAEIYQYIGDVREDKQDLKVKAMMAEYQRGTWPYMGGSTRLKLARGRFL